MPQQASYSVQNNFTKGLITESTGLNFPENAATDADNCEFTLIGDTLRRQGIDFEDNFGSYSIDRSNLAISNYKWNNAGGDGLTQVYAAQVGSLIHFWGSSVATVTAPLSTQILASSINLSSFVAAGGTLDVTKECQFSDGNGYLFIYHPSCDPIYCTYNAGTITGTLINVQIRDFVGLPDSLAVTARPAALGKEHNYNLTNQGWTSGSSWSAQSTQTKSGNFVTNVTFTVASGLSITGGDTCRVYCTDPLAANLGVNGATVIAAATVASYSGTTLVITPTSNYGGLFSTFSWTGWNIIQTNQGHITAWQSAIGNYPSNADVWWYYKDTTDVFNPTVTAANVTINSQAPQGHFIMNAFNQQRSLLSSVAGLTDVVTTVRPRTGAWFQGRVWYTGVDASFPASGDAPHSTWTENIYFSQIVEDVDDFGQCLQENDPTSETLFDLLPTDGGVIRIQGCGSIFKLFPIQNGMLVFASNGIWFITGSQGIGFTANDYTITKISSVQSISGTSFVNVNGLPYFWNEEGIYAVQPSQQGGLSVEPLTVGTILSLYNLIPLSSKKYARGDYHPIDYNIQWIYKDTEATNITDRYSFNKILNFNTYNKAFYPYSVDSSHSSINGITYIAGPGGLNSTEPSLKYLASYPFGATYGLTFADEHDEDYVDWASSGADTTFDYSSYFITGYKLSGKAITKFQPTYIQVYCRVNEAASSYKIQGIWDYANDRSSGRWSNSQVITSVQLVTNALTRFSTIFRRHKIRGHGYALQFKIQSVTGMPFDIQGWAVADSVNQGP